MRATTTRPVQAAGALIWRVRTGRLQVALVHRPRYDDWSWPKGKQEPGESIIETAVREVAEETGLEVVLGIPLPGLQYLVGGRPKQVHYWAAQVGGRPDRVALAARPPVPRASTDEVDRVRWFDAHLAARRLTRPDCRGPLAALVAAHEAGLLTTRSLVVARHSRARKRVHWTGTELDRPLTPTGTTQAAGLVPVLSAFGVTQVVTSRWARCEQTLAPYCAATGIRPALSDLLTEDSHTDFPARVAAEIEDLLDTPRDVVVCTHRPVLPTVFQVLARHSTPEATTALPATDPYLKPGHLLVAHVLDTPQGPSVVAVQAIDPMQ